MTNSLSLASTIASRESTTTPLSLSLSFFQKGKPNSSNLTKLGFLFCSCFEMIGKIDRERLARRPPRLRDCFPNEYPDERSGPSAPTPPRLPSPVPATATTALPLTLLLPARRFAVPAMPLRLRAVARWIFRFDHHLQPIRSQRPRLRRWIP